MSNYKILQYAVGNYFKICEWPAESKEQAIAEFLKDNPQFNNRVITAWKI